MRKGSIHEIILGINYEFYIFQMQEDHFSFAI